MIIETSSLTKVYRTDGDTLGGNVRLQRQGYSIAGR